MFVIETPPLDRLYVVQKVARGLEDMSVLSESERLFVADLTMTATINSLAQTNPMVFSGLEDAMMN